MDVKWVEERLEEYIAICDEYAERMRANGNNYDDACRDLDNRAEVRAATVTRIVRELDPTWTGQVKSPGYVSSEGGRVARRTLGALRDRAEWQERLAPDAPIVRADRLHELVWRAASTVWDTGEYRLAVQQAATALSAHIKSLAKSRMSDRSLMQQAFSADAAKPGQNRLHLPGDHDDETWKSRQQGLQLVAQGAFAALRNVAVHTDAEWSHDESLEYLAILSVVARWTDETSLEEIP